MAVTGSRAGGKVFARNGGGVGHRRPEFRPGSNAVRIATAVRVFGFAMLGCLLLLAMLAAGGAEPAMASGGAGERYFIEFRARPGPFIGHTYVVYGRADADGRILDQQ